MARCQVPSGPQGRVFSFPTKWTVKQSFLWQDMSIQDEWGNEVYKAEAQTTAMWAKFHIYDTRTGQLVARTRRVYGFGMPKHQIIIGR